MLIKYTKMSLFLNSIFISSKNRRKKTDIINFFKLYILFGKQQSLNPIPITAALVKYLQIIDYLSAYEKSNFSIFIILNMILKFLKIYAR